VLSAMIGLKCSLCPRFDARSVQARLPSNNRTSGALALLSLRLSEQEDVNPRICWSQAIPPDQNTRPDSASKSWDLHLQGFKE